MSREREDLQNEAARILEILSTTQFEDCHELTREFADVTPRPGIYAFRQRHEGILYIGKSRNVRQRLRGGHKALGWAFIDRYDPNDVRIVAVVLGWKAWQNCLDLEALMIQTIRPRYNIQIRQEE